MRTVLSILALLAAALVLLGVKAFVEAGRAEQARIDATRAAAQRLFQEINIQRAVGSVELTARGWPVKVDPSWFEDSRPINRTLDLERPWLEIAPPSQADLEHPPVRIAMDETYAAFWYNPYTGVVRARAPQAVSDRRAAEIYSDMNTARVAQVMDIKWLAREERRQDELRRRLASAAMSAALEGDYDGADDSVLDPTKPRDR